MAFGYEILISPLQTLTLYNAVANNGRMMRPYLVSAVAESGNTVKETQPETLADPICSENTLRQLQECLAGVCDDPDGTAVTVFRNSFYKVAGKTGTALVANGSHGYAEHIYQSSFVGYFPAEHPKYTCIVVIKHKPFAKTFYGAKVAAPVFKEVADRLMSTDPDEAVAMTGTPQSQPAPPIADAPPSAQSLPDVTGMGLKDALFRLESLDLRVAVRGSGKVRSQNPAPGTALQKNETIFIQLD